MKFTFLITALFYDKYAYIEMSYIENQKSRERFFYDNYEEWKKNDEKDHAIFHAVGNLNPKQQRRLFDKLIKKETLDKYDKEALMFCWKRFTNDKKKETFEDLKSQLTKNNFNLSETITDSFGSMNDIDKIEMLQFLNEKNIFHSKELNSLIMTCLKSGNEAALILFNHPKTKDSILHLSPHYLKIDLLYSYMKIEQKKEYFNFLLNKNFELTDCNYKEHKKHLNYFYLKLSNELEPNDFKNMIDELNSKGAENLFKILSQKETLSKKDFDLLTYVYFAKKQGSLLPIVYSYSDKYKKNN